MLKLLFCLRTFTEFYSHIHAFILTKQTIINTDCGEGMHFSALVPSFCHSVCSILSLRMYIFTTARSKSVGLFSSARKSLALLSRDV